jgi:hypothetical protein
MFWSIDPLSSHAALNWLANQVVRRNASRTRVQLTSLLRAFVLSLTLVLPGCAAQGPPGGLEQFADVAQKLRAFPPAGKFFVTGYGPAGKSVAFGGPPVELKRDIPMGWPVTPGTAEYQALMKADYPVPFLLSLLNNRDPKIRTLAAAALVAKGDPRLQRHLGVLVHDQGSTFDAITTLLTDNYTPPHYTPQTVAAAVLSLVEIPTAELFDEYWAVHANREYCADWFLWQFHHAPFDSVARQQIENVPSPDRELIILWIGKGRSDFENERYAGYSDKELLDAAKHLGRENVLATLRGQPPTTDPDIRATSDKGIPIGSPSFQRYSKIVYFLLAHAKDLLDASDADALLDLETAERNIKNPQHPVYREWWPIAAASLRPNDADAILDAAETRWPQAPNIQLARWDIQGQASLPKILRWFYHSPQAQQELALAIERADPNDYYQTLVGVILTSDGRLHINGEAMYRLGVLGRTWKANFDQQIVDWVFAQPPDPDLGIMGPSRRLVIDTSGVARKLILDPRFNEADGQLLYVIEQSLVPNLKLSHTQLVRLGQLIPQIYSQHPQSIPEPILQEVRNLLRQGVSGH